MTNAGWQMTNAGCRMPDAGYRIPDTGRRMGGDNYRDEKDRPRFPGARMWVAPSAMDTQLSALPTLTVSLGSFLAV